MANDKRLRIAYSAYLGGLADDGHTHPGYLIADDDAIGIGIGIGSKQPKKAVIPIPRIAGLSIESETTARSRAGKAIAFGVFALAAKSTQTNAILTVHLQDGQQAIYRVGQRISPSTAHAQLATWAARHNLRWVDQPQLPDTTPAAPSSTAEQLAQLAQLHASGALDDAEYAAAKQHVLN